jgi:hypothetical protein
MLAHGGLRSRGPPGSELRAPATRRNRPRAAPPAGERPLLVVRRILARAPRGLRSGRARKLAAHLSSRGDATPAIPSGMSRPGQAPFPPTLVPERRISVPSRLVSIVTPRMRGGVARERAAAAAAESILGPPDACTVRSETGSPSSARIARSTVVGMSWSFRSRKILLPRSASAWTAWRPEAQKSWRPTLYQRIESPRRSTWRRAVARSGVSSATIRWSRRARERPVRAARTRDCHDARPPCSRRTRAPRG